MGKFKANDNKNEEHEINYRQFNKKLELLNQILSLISDINQASDEKEVKDCIPALLQYIGEYTDADRVYIFELISEKQDYYSNTFEWCREGIIPQIDNLIHIPIASVPVWHEKFFCGETIMIHDLEKIRETMPLEYDILKVQDIHSLLALPLFANMQLSGFIGLDNPDLVNPGVSISLLSNVGGHLASTLNNLRMFRMLEEKQKTLESNLEELRRTAQEAEKANLAKTDFLRRMSHDVRTPINGIQGCVDIADRYPDNLKLQQEARTKIRTASGYLLNLVNDVLDMNKLESGNIELERKHFNLLEVLHNTNEITRMQANEAGVNYYVEDGEIIHTQLIGSPVHFEQILMNIGSNAVKYNHDGGSVTVSCREVSYTDTTAEYELTCTDTGIGMSEEFQKKAFEPFAQEGQSARTKYAGTGLGLAIARKLIELQGGTIFFESIQGKGTKFILRIPFEISAEEQEKKSHMYQNCSVEGVQVLLVEDNELNMEIAEFLLKEEKMIVTKAWNGREAVEIFEDSEPGYFDVILMDLMMPQMGGLEATRRIRKMDREDAKSIPIFAMTANAFLDDIAQSKAAGMNEHFSKPLQMEKVIDTIRFYCTAR